MKINITEKELYIISLALNTYKQCRTDVFEELDVIKLYNFFSELTEETPC